MKYLLTLCMLLAAVAATAQTVSRKAILTKGQRFERLSEVSMEFEMDLMGKKEKLVNGGKRLTAITVEQVLDTSYVLNSKVLRKTERSIAPGKNIDFDSEKPADTAYKAEWNKFIKGVGELSRVVVSRKGYYMSRGDTVEDFQDGGIMASLKGDSDTGRKTYELFADLPLKMIKAGDSWTDSTISEKSQERCYYTLTSLTPKEGVIALKTTADVQTEIDGENQKITIIMKASSNSTIVFDPATGLVRAQENKINGSGTFSMQGFTIPLTIRGTNTETVKMN